jgi:hypothetical protein
MMMETLKRPAVQSLRYRAAMRLAYSVALLFLIEHARDSKDSYEFGPMNLDALEDQGLVVTGADLAGVQKILADIPGLFLSED